MPENGRQSEVMRKKATNYNVLICDLSKKKISLKLTETLA